MHKAIRPVDALIDIVHSFNLFSVGPEDFVQKGLSQKVIPDCLADIWLTKGGVIRVSLDNKTFYETPECCVWGLFDCPSYDEFRQRTDVFSIKFYPWAFNAHFNYPIQNLLNTNVDLQKFMESEYIEKLKRVWEKETLEDKVKLAEEILIGLLDSDKTPNTHVVEAYKMIEESKGNVLIFQLTRKLGITRQYLNKLFRIHTGLSLKKYMCIYRIRLCVDCKLDTRDYSLTRIAHEFGFFDQAHFIRQFRSILGESPRAFLTRKHLLKQHMRE